jgi:YebC/PmpR family DNA-binding regulatory protein
MRRDTIDTAIKKASGTLEGVHYEAIRYEGYGAGGVAVIVDCLTDNKQRTVGEVRHAFSKSGGNLGTDGSVAYLFSKLGVISYTSNVDEDALMEAAIDAGADDVITNDDGSKDVITTLENYLNVKEALVAGGFEPESAEITMQASTKAELDAEDAEKMMLLIERLEDLDDVQNVYSNGDISDEIMASMS